MKKISIFLIVALLVVSGVMAAMAYSSASVENPAYMQVVSTDDALVELNASSGVGYKDITSWVGDDGRLHFDFSRGKGEHPGWLPFGQQRGFQPGSTYVWDELFTIKNQSNDNVEYTIEQEGLEYISVSIVKIAGAGVNLPLIEDGVNLGKAGGMASGDTAVIKVSFDIPEDADVENLTGTLTIKTRAVETAGRHNLKNW